jgi:hypothetical protein
MAAVRLNLTTLLPPQTLAFGATKSTRPVNSAMRNGQTPASFPQPDTRPFPVRLDKDHPGLFQGGADGGDGRRGDLPPFPLKVNHG